MNRFRRVPNLLSIISHLASQRGGRDARARGSLRSACSPFVGGLLAALLLFAAPGVFVDHAAADPAAWTHVSSVAAPIGIELFAARPVGASVHAPRRSPTQSSTPFAAPRSGAPAIVVSNAAPQARAVPHRDAAIVARGYDATAPPASPSQF